MRRIILVALLALLVASTIGTAQQPAPTTPPVPAPPLVQALRDEMSRAMAGLRMPDQPAPYFIAYTLSDTTLTTVSATLGSIVHDVTQRARQVRVEVRVGDYARDNSRFPNLEFDPGIAASYASGVIQGPLDEDLDVLRRQLWLVTDAAYRRAVSTFAKKQAALQNQVATEPIPDFSRETPQQRIEPTPAAAKVAAPSAMVSIGVEVSAALKAPEIASSEVALYAIRGTRYYVNTEGFTTITPIQSAGVRVGAESQAADGMPIRDLFTELARTPEGLPPTPTLVARARELAAGLATLRAAPMGDDYTGPVLVEQQAASELLAQTLVPLFLSLRPPEAANTQMAAAMARMPSSPYLTRIGSKALPEPLTVRDTPSLRLFQGKDVLGSYVVDDEGVSAQDVTLCEKGVLKSLLTSRTPQRGFLQSNGHSRGGLAQAGVFQLEWAGGVPAGELKARYLARLKQEGRPFGYILRAIGPYATPPPDAEAMMRGMGAAPSGPSNAPIIRAFKVTADGQETLVRGLQVGDVSHNAWRDVVDASEDRTLYSYRGTLPPQMRRLVMLAPGVSASDATVSIIAPNLIFGELDIQKTNAVFQRPPIVASPLTK